MSNLPSYAPTVRLLVRLQKGQFVQENGSPLPALRENALCELIINSSDLSIQAERDNLTREKTVDALPKGSALWARVRPNEDIPATLARHRENKKCSQPSSYAYVKFVLDAPLRLVASDGNQPVLAECPCHIPGLPHVACQSVNEAYTRISEAFEPTRRSHTGNVFACVNYEVESVLQPLSNLRGSARPAAPNLGDQLSLS
jgi:hypothetical protein